MQHAQQMSLWSKLNKQQKGVYFTAARLSQFKNFPTVSTEVKAYTLFAKHSFFDINKISTLQAHENFSVNTLVEQPWNVVVIICANNRIYHPQWQQSERKCHAKAYSKIQR